MSVTLPTHLPRSSAVLDVLIAAVATALAVVMVATEAGEGDPTTTPLAYVVASVAGGFLIVRRRYPSVALVIAGASHVTTLLDAGNNAALIPVFVVALFTAAERGEGRRALVVAIPVALISALVQWNQEGDSLPLELLGEFTLALLPIAIGEVVRSRAERTRNLIETEASARVQAERLRIARDLHDVAAHGLSTIALQSGVAARLLDRDVAQAKEALEVINAASKRSLEDLRAMVGVLRSSDEAPLRPTPSDPNDFAGLIEEAVRNGVSVATQVEGSFPVDAHDASVVAAHRVIEEALANVASHAGRVPAQVSIRHGPHQVCVTIRNEPGGTSGSTQLATSTGVGIVGMSERVETLGGKLAAQPGSDGGFVVTATIPYYGRQR